MRLLLLIIALVATPLAAQPAPADPESVLRKAVELHRSGDIDGAIRAYREYLAGKPGAFEARSNLGAALARAGRYDDAIVEYNRALADGGNNPAVLLNLALAFYKTDRVAEAAARLEQVAAAGQPNWQVSMLLASCYVRLGRYHEAVALLDPLAKERLDDPGFDYLFGTALIRDGQPARGGAAIDRLMRRGDSAEARLLLGTTKLQANDFDGALADLKKAIELNPKLLEAHSRYGQLLLTMGDPTAAAAAFTEELRLNATDFMANLNMGVLAKQKQEYSDARLYFERALRSRPGDPGVRYQIATLDVATGNLDRARGELEKLVAESPAFAEAHASLATVYYRLDRAEDAEREHALAEKLAEEQRAAQSGRKAK